MSHRALPAYLVIHTPELIGLFQQLKALDRYAGVEEDFVLETLVDFLNKPISYNRAYGDTMAHIVNACGFEDEAHPYGHAIVHDITQQLYAELKQLGLYTHNRLPYEYKEHQAGYRIVLQRSQHPRY